MMNFKNIVVVVGLVLVFNGCSAKEFKEGANGIGNDISKLFEVRE